MPTNRFRVAAITVAGSLLISGMTVGAQGTPEASPIASPTASPLGAVSVVASASVPNDLMVDGTLVGGLSGIDYDPVSDDWIVLSDDRSDSAPARSYALDLAYDDTTITTLELPSTTTLLQANGEPYPNAEVGGNVPDPEAIRFDPLSDAIWYTSEGSYELDIDPFVAASAVDGQFIAAPAVPEIFAMSGGAAAEELGPRENLVFEGLSFSADGQSLWLAMEGPLFQDGEPSTFQSTSLTRLTNLDRAGNVLGQYAYELDTLPEEPTAFATMGVTEILAIDDDRFLVIERGGIETPEAFNNYIKIYEVDISGATDVSELAALGSLSDGSFTPATKTVMLDLNATDVTPIDNVEGISWGPDFTNGNRSLVLVADNNFSDTQVNQFIVLQVEG